MLGPVLAVLGALTHLILINSTRERGGGEGAATIIVLLQTQSYTRDGLPGTLASEPSFTHLYHLLP